MSDADQMSFTDDAQLLTSSGVVNSWRRQRPRREPADVIHRARQACSAWRAAPAHLLAAPAPVQVRSHLVPSAVHRRGWWHIWNRIKCFSVRRQNTIAEALAAGGSGGTGAGEGVDGVGLLPAWHRRHLAQTPDGERATGSRTRGVKYVSGSESSWTLKRTGGAGLVWGFVRNSRQVHGRRESVHLGALSVRYENTV